MKHIAVVFLIGSLLLGGVALPAEAGGWRHGHHFHHHGHGHDHFFGGFLAGAGTVLILDALLIPRVVYAPPYRAPVCQNIWVPGRWELQPRGQNGFTSYYQVWVPGYWQQQCF